MIKKKTTLGRRKIEIRKIQKADSRQVTFTKRRYGLFNKASELCALTGADVAILVQSPGNHMFTYGHADSVIDKYLGTNVLNFPAPCIHEEEEYYRKEYAEINKAIQAEKNKSTDHHHQEEKNNNFDHKNWWEQSFKNLDAGELEIYIESMEQLKTNVTKKADELINFSASTTSSLDDNLFDSYNSDEELWKSVAEFLNRDDDDDVGASNVFAQAADQYNGFDCNNVQDLAYGDQQVVHNDGYLYNQGNDFNYSNADGFHPDDGFGQGLI